jgi:RNase H-fold protein (predicted Holliday junction resolvase)
MTAPRRRFIGIDPGRTKCGIAVVDEHGARESIAVVSADAVGEHVAEAIAAGGVVAICIGDATASRQIAQLCKTRWPEIAVHVVDETNTTYQARRRYYEENPPKGLLRFVPRGLLVPSVPLDGYAAVLIVERYLRPGLNQP